MLCARRYSILFFALICVGLGRQASADDAIFRVYNIDSDTGLDLGRGFDILTETPRSQCVETATTVEHPEYGPNSVVFRSYRIESAEQLDKVLGVSASASIKMGVGGVDAAMSYAGSLSVSSYSLNYIVEATVAQKGKGFNAQNLQERYKRLLSSGNPDAYRRFRTICGDGYVTEIPMGGSFKALIEISVKSRAEAEAISASIGGSYGAVSASASFTSAVKSIAKTNDVRIWSIRRGGNGHVPITPDDIANTAADLPNAVKHAPVPLQIAVMSYVAVLDDPSLPLSTFAERAGQIERLAMLSRRARDQLSDAYYILSHPNEFQGQVSDAIALGSEINSLNDFRSVVNLRADQCISADGVCLIDDLTIPSPIARPARR